MLQAMSELVQNFSQTSGSVVHAIRPSFVFLPFSFHTHSFAQSVHSVQSAGLKYSCLFPYTFPGPPLSLLLIYYMGLFLRRSHLANSSRYWDCCLVRLPRLASGNHFSLNLGFFRHFDANLSQRAILLDLNVSIPAISNIFTYDKP